MIRFIDLGKQIAVDETDPDYPREFTFYNTITDTFLRFNGFSTWDSWEDFMIDYGKPESKTDEVFINRLKNLCPPWVFAKVIFDESKTTRNVGEVIEWLNQFSKDCMVYAYEGEMDGIVVVSKDLKQQLGSLKAGYYSLKESIK